MRLKLFSLLFLGFGLTGLQAQENIIATGGEAIGDEGTVSYSVGQSVFRTHTGTNASVSEGVQQPYEISFVTGTEEIRGIYLTISAFPNPTTDNLTLIIEGFVFSGLSYQLYDMNGKLLQKEIITAYQTKIDMSRLNPATYFVKVFQGNEEVRTFQIIKN